ncbi:MAG: peptide ABC transporter permease [Maricaulis sp.]|jgi:putative ABC transport system permease protein|nr:peptide ABC transporter permease [Maricaulis sp.]HAQ34581.1 peptide ABC transporter permease [Alphaproteobacteria bacterium]|tara:strand:- start:278 stop:1453 length:1176 start_codon:yes stop_codon:yes gene_type:complete
MKQLIAVIMMNIRSIPQRLGMSLATILSVAFMVGVLLGFLAMANGFQKTVDGSGSDDVAVFVRGGSQAEINSVLAREDARLIEVAPGIAVDDAGRAILSAELYVVVDGIKRSSQTEANMPLRGVQEQAVNLRQNFELTAGRMFAPGTAELIVGEGVIREFEGFDLGQTIRLGSNNWTIVGTFSTGGSVFDSEIWADLGVVQNLYQRGSSIQSIRVRMTSPEALEGIQTYIEAEDRLNVDVTSEREYFAQSAGGIATLLKFVGWPLSIVMAIGAFAGAWNTMYSSVDARTREIATLRTIGFSGFAAFMGTLIESLVLALLGGVVGVAAIYLVFNGMSASTLGGGFTQIVFSFAVTGGSVIAGLVLALSVGFLGGIIPGIRAANVPLLAVHSD